MTIVDQPRPRVVRVEAQGFKSFAARVDLPLLAGITAVVGPNGTGKSNLMDAVRWAMGEQRLRQMRAERSEDLLFAGSQSRRPALAAECALTILNPDSALGLDTAEVEIRRRLTRAGEMSYFVNGRPSRLRDVEEILAAAGLGSGGYAVVGQGQVDAVLRARPRERRTLIEEAAGISSLEGERSRALATLASGEAERVALSTRLEELDRRVDGLREEAKRADRDRRLAQGIVETEALLLRGRLKEAMRQQEEARQAVVDIERRLAQSARASESIGTRQTGLEVTRQATEGLGARLSARLAEVREARLRAGMEERQRAGLLGAAQQDVDAWTRRRDEGRARLDGLVRDVAEAARGIPDLERRAAALLARVESRDEDGERSAARERTQRLEELGRERARLAVEITHTGEEALSAEERLSRARTDLANLGEARTAAVARAQAARAAVDASRRRVSEVRQATERAREAWIRAQAERAGRHDSRGADLVLEATAEGRLEGVLGLLGDLVEIPSALSLAIQSALGGSVHDLVTTSARDAEAAVAYLRGKGGRATFLPLDTLKPRPVRSAPERSGVLGVAFDLVTFDPTIRLAVLHRLGGVWVVDTLQVALEVGRETGMSHRIVTLEGDLLQPGGAITGGAPQAARQGRHPVAPLRVALEEVQAELARAETTAEAAEAAADTARGEVTRLERDEAGVAVRVETEARESDALRQRLERLKAERAHLETEEGEILALEGSFRERLERRKDSAHEQEGTAEAERRPSPGGGDGETPIGDPADDLTRYREAQDALGRLRTHVAVTEEAVRGARLEMTAAEDALREAQQRLADLQAAGELQARQKADRDLTALEAALSEAQVDATRLGDGCHRLISRLSAHRQRLEVETATLRAERIALDEAVIRSQRTVGDLRGRIEQDYGADALTGRAPTAAEIDGLTRRLERLRAERAGLGPVWQGAEDALQDLETRRAALSEEIEAMQAGRRALTALAESTRRRMEAQIAQTLEQVEGAFRRTAQGLLGARGELAHAEDGGITIALTLPGKRRTDLTALSGGERALGALAFLFALMTVRPSALVVLDEVDAALDGHNAASFARHLRSLAATQQFLVITHQRPVMEGADALIGVTSREGGVTQLVTVHLDGDTDEDPEGADTGTLALR